MPHFAELFRLADRAGLLRDPIWHVAAWCACWPCTGSPDALTRERPIAALDQHGDGAQAAAAPRHHRGLRAARDQRHRSLARPGPGRGPGAGRPAGEGRRHHAQRLLSRRFFSGSRRRRPGGRAGGQPPCRRRGQDARRLMPGAGGGCLPGALAGKPSHTDIGLARAQVQDGIAATLEYARGVGMPLAIEPLHPMQAAERACINTLEQALDICDALDPGRTGALGVALDVYHVWWDPKLAGQIARGGPRPAARLPRLRLAGADARPPQRPRHDGRRHHRAPEDPGLGGGRRLHRPRRGGDLLGRLVEPPGRRGARYVLGPVQDGGMSCHAGVCRA